MARICNSRAKIYETRGVILDEPVEHVESEGERLVKQMVQKQLDTSTSLQQELTRENNFRTVAEILPLTEYVCGEKSLEEFEKTAEKAAHVEELKSLGLSGDEIEILLNYTKEGFLEKHRKTEKSVLSSHLHNALRKVEQAKKQWKAEQTKQSGSSLNSRHEREIGLCVKPDSEYTKLLNFVLSCQKPKDARPPNHPINNLKNIEEDLFGHLVKKQKLSPIYKSKERCLSSKETTHSEFSYEKGVSLWDVTSSDCNTEKFSRNKIENSRHIYTCKEEYMYTLKNGEIVPLSKTDSKKKRIDDRKDNSEYVVPDMTSDNVLISLENISKNCLSLEEIKSIPKFSAYAEGIPTQVLYIKNLASNVTRDDLASLFGHFQSNSKSRILYRLMDGRMKGQAFITFPSIALAEEALKLVNGYVLKGKPIIIQYGKGKTSFDVTR